MIRYATEFIGTFFLVLTVGLVILTEAPLGALAIGSVLMVMVYMGAHVSGAHYNPAVSLAAGFLGKLEKRELLPYWLSQLAGAIAAALAVRAILGRTFAPAPGLDASAAAALLVEVLFTFALCLVVLNAATHPKTQGEPLLRPGDRLHRARRRHRGWTDLGRCVQPRGRRRTDPRACGSRRRRVSRSPALHSRAPGGRVPRCPRLPGPRAAGLTGADEQETALRPGPGARATPARFEGREPGGRALFRLDHSAARAPHRLSFRRLRPRSSPPGIPYVPARSAHASACPPS